MYVKADETEQEIESMSKIWISNYEHQQRSIKSEILMTLQKRNW